jgi:eukaryotic-like serine/threonine-protein kinase
MDYPDWTTTGALGDRYVLRAEIGSGRTTTVYSAEDVRLEREVAVKIFHGLPSGDAMARFAAEAQVLGGLSHAGLVTVYDVGLAADPPYMVMRLIDGGPLSERMDEELEPRAVARLGAQLSDTLAYVHERGVVHGDIDESNVLIDAKGRGHLTGFGADSGFTRPFGDIYALGMMLSACLPDGLGPEWQVVFSAMTDPDPEERPDAVRCGELFRNLASGETADIPLLADEIDVEAPPAEVAAPAAKPKKVAPAFAGLAGIGLAAAAVAVVLTTGSGPPGAPAEDQRQPVDQPEDEPALPKVPGQTYPDQPAQREVSQQPPTSRESNKNEVSTRTPSPSDENGGQDDEDGPGNGNGNGQGNGNGNDDDGGLLGGILGGLL